MLRYPLEDLSVFINAPTTECSETAIGRLRHYRTISIDADKVH